MSTAAVRLRRAIAALTVGVLTVTGLTLATPPAQAASVTVTDPGGSGASITLSSNRIGPGERIEISGQGFTPVEGSSGDPLVAVRPYDFDAGPAWAVGGEDAYFPSNPSIPPASEAKYWFVTDHADGGSFHGWIEAPTNLTSEGPLGNGQHWLRILSGAFFTSTGDRLTVPITFQVPFTVRGDAAVTTGLTSPTAVFQAGTTFRPGAQVTVRGSGFEPETAVAVTLDGSPLAASIATQEDGDLPASARVALPSELGLGQHTLALATGSQSASVSLTVTAAPTATVLTPSVRPGGVIAFDLTGYVGVGGAGQKVAVVVNEAVLACIQAGPDGAASGVATLPAGLDGTVVVGFNVGLSCVLPPAGVINDQPISRLAPTVLVGGAAPVLTVDAATAGGSLALSGEGFTPSATVAVSVDGTAAGALTADASGRLSGSVAAPSAVGTYRVLANDGSQVAAASATVATMRAATVALTAPAPLTYGANRTTTVTLKAADAAASGSVVVTQGDWTTTVPVGVSGTAVALPRTVGVGSHTVTVAFAGDASTSPATASRTFTVVKASSTASLKLSKSKVKRTKKATITVRVAVAGAEVAPTGTVKIYDGKKKLRTVTLKAGHAGVLKVTLPKIKKKGTHKLKVVYSGNANVTGKTSKTVKLKIVK